LAASRCPRVCVARGSIEYSAVTQPEPLPRSHGGIFSSTLAVTRTRVSPKPIRHEPSACLVKPVSMVMARISSGARPDGRMWNSFSEMRLATRWSAVMPLPPVSELNDRARGIFRLVVESYLASGQPVGSKSLAGEGGVNLSPASIRSVLAELEMLGLLAAPHTSAGRMP